MRKYELIGKYIFIYVRQIYLFFYKTKKLIACRGRFK